MVVNNSQQYPFSLYPNLSELTLALIRRVVEPVLGKDAIEVLEEPYSKQQLYTKLCDVLSRAEQKLISNYQNTRVAEYLIQLKISDLPPIQKAFWRFVENPATSDFEHLLYDKMNRDYQEIADSERIQVVNHYIKILKVELIGIDEEVRQKISAAALGSIENLVISIDNKLNKLSSIDEGIARIVNIMLSSAKLPDKSANSQVMNLEGRSTAVSKKVNEPDMETQQAQSIDKVENTLTKAMSGLNLDEMQKILTLVEDWVPPLIESCLDRDDFDRPYGLICDRLIDSLALPVKYSTYPIIRSDPKEREEIVNAIFKSDTVESLPHDSERNSVYLKSLSTQFPSYIQIEKPFGFYLMDRSLRYTNGGMVQFTSASSISRLCIVCITDTKLNGWEKLTRVDRSPYNIRYRSWREQIQSFFKNIAHTNPHYCLHIMTYKEKSIEFYSSELWSLGKPSTYILDLNLERFSAFVSSFVEDFILLASNALIIEREKRKKAQDLANKFRNPRER